MKSTEALLRLMTWAQPEGRCVFRRGELARILGEPRAERGIESTVRALVKSGALNRVSRDTYVVPTLAASADTNVLEQIALAIGGANLVIESLESAGSQWGIVSQIYARGLTCVTTGRTREVKGPYGIISLVHTDMDKGELVHRSSDRGPGRLRITDLETTIHFLRRTGRHQHIAIEYAGGNHGEQ